MTVEEGLEFFENIPRMLPEGVKAIMKKNSYEVPAIFDLIAKNYIF